MKKINENSIVLCGGKACCPVLTVENNTVYIEDDHGNEVQMDKKQALLIVRAIKELEK
tara:strand:+ start:2104 stop:2277 length:174 start_codon:yes stop_codon:yes gene_type:complete